MVIWDWLILNVITDCLLYGRYNRVRYNGVLSLFFRWGSKRLFNIEKPKQNSPVFCPEMLELQRKMKTLQKTFRPGTNSIKIDCQEFSRLGWLDLVNGVLVLGLSKYCSRCLQKRWSLQKWSKVTHSVSLILEILIKNFF